MRLRRGEEKAIVKAFEAFKIERGLGGFVITESIHTVTFVPEGISFAPRRKQLKSNDNSIRSRYAVSDVFSVSVQRMRIFLFLILGQEFLHCRCSLN